jgi:acyl-CoA thioester hydrolase
LLRTIDPCNNGRAKEKSLRFVHEMHNDETGKIAARTTLKAVHLDTQARKSCAFPESVVSCASALIAADPQPS